MLIKKETGDSPVRIKTYEEEGDIYVNRDGVSTQYLLYLLPCSTHLRLQDSPLECFHILSCYRYEF